MSFLPNQELAAKILAITGLALAPFTTFLGRHYSRTLYFAQLLFLFAFIFNTTGQPSFSQYLGFTWLSFMPTFTDNYCTEGDFSCSYGFLISPAICWVGGAVILFLLTKLIACKIQNVRFLKVYSFYRGFFYWFFAPLTYYSTVQIIEGIQNRNLDYSWVPAVVVLGVFAVIAFMELISAKCAQRYEQNIWRKWIYFFCHLQVSSMVVLVAIHRYCGSNVARYLLNIPLALYAIIFLIEYKFMYKVGQRVSVFIQDAIIITVYNIFVTRSDYITQYNLDFFGLAIVAALQFIFLLPKLVREWNKEDASSEFSIVCPVKGQKAPERQQRKNNMGAGAMYMPNDSYQGLYGCPNLRPN